MIIHHNSKKPRHGIAQVSTELQGLHGQGGGQWLQILGFGTKR
jgi:hypothetical protein